MKWKILWSKNKNDQTALRWIICEGKLGSSEVPILRNRPLLARAASLSLSFQSQVVSHKFKVPFKKATITGLEIKRQSYLMKFLQPRCAHWAVKACTHYYTVTGACTGSTVVTTNQKMPGEVHMTFDRIWRPADISRPVSHRRIRAIDTPLQNKTVLFLENRKQQIYFKVAFCGINYLTSIIQLKLSISLSLSHTHTSAPSTAGANFWTGGLKYGAKM